MKKSIRITEQELNKIVKKIINEQDFDVDYEFVKADNYAGEIMEEMKEHFISLFYVALRGLPLREMIMEYQNTFKEKYPQYVGEDYINDYIDSLMDISTDFNYNDIAFYLSEHLMDVLMDNTYYMSE